VRLPIPPPRHFSF